MNLDKKVAVVTGANRGIGAGVAVELARYGARVVVNYPPGATPPMLREPAVSVEADLTESSGRQRLIQAAVERFGRIDILVNNAGFDPGPTPFLDMPEDLYDRIFALNARAVFFTSQLAARQMIAQGGGGRIIHISSVHGRASFPDRAAYAASKGAVDAMTRAMALDLASHGITVNAIAPGLIEVERVIEQAGDYDRAAMAARIPAARVGFPNDIGEAIAFLASGRASYITGHVLCVDGGMTARLAF